jgi:DNA-binding transcriptional ArsR family regulator
LNNRSNVKTSSLPGDTIANLRENAGPDRLRARFTRGETIPMLKKRRETKRRSHRPGSKRLIPGLAQMRALSHPLRFRLLELFAERPRTTKQAAQQMGEAPTRLYHHVAALEKAGLVRLRETRPNRGTTEKYFEAVARRIEGGEQVVKALRRKGTRRDLAAIGFVLFDQARNELFQALASGSGKLPEALMAIRGVLQLSPRGAVRLGKELMRVVRKRRTARPGAARSSRKKLQRYSLTIALIPAEES